MRAVAEAERLTIGELLALHGAGIECVWHSHAMVRPDYEIDSDGRPQLRGIGVSFLSTFSSDQSFDLDGGTGQILVRPFASSSATSLKDRTRGW